MKNTYGSISTFLGITILVFMISMALAPGRLSHWFNFGITTTLPSRPIENGPELRDVGFFSMTTYDEHRFFASICVVMSVICLVMSLMSLIKREHTIFPAIGMFSCVGALTLVNGMLSIGYALIAFIGVYVVQRNIQAR